MVIQRSAPGPTQWAAVLWGVAKAGRPCTDLQVLDAEGLRTGATFVIQKVDLSIDSSQELSPCVFGVKESASQHFRRKGQVIEGRSSTPGLAVFSLPIG